MLWNELEYSAQLRVLDKIVSLLEKEEDCLMQDGLMAAVHELETWSNTPCQSIDSYDDHVKVAIAQDPEEL